MINTILQAPTSSTGAPVEPGAGRDNKGSILQMFVADANEYRAYLRTPWRNGERIYASNGQILVRLDAEGMQAPELPADISVGLRNVDRLFDAPLPLGYVSAPDVVTNVLCETCRGSGKRRFSHCDECKGRGEFLRGSYVYACLGCEGSGEVPDDAGYKTRPCADCRGYGVDSLRTDTNALAIGPARFATRYLGLVARLPGAEIAVVNATAPAIFRFRDGDGLLAPVQA